ncbi:hypothetical protein D0T23_26175 [Duganella sp. BJB475]|nr:MULTISPECIES: transporter substrate-binding domain-containing protein [unclassified Duganella]RFP09207.1 hypothetical protein D0T23_26175 [Duganella sp. BJB475]RFP25433.1 hypothetical protein D0T21_28260 [Duganella sp. BJB476]
MLANRVDLIPSSRYMILFLAKQLNALDKIEELVPAVESVPTYVAFSKKKEFSDVIAKYNRTLSAMKLDGTYQKIIYKYTAATRK